MFITILDKDNNLVASYVGTIDASEQTILNNNYQLAVEKKEPIFTDIGNNIIKYYPKEQFEKKINEAFNV